MNGFIGTIIKVIFFPFKLVGKLLSVTGKHLKFVNHQLSNDKELKQRINTFYKRKKKQQYLNDEFV